MRKKIELEYVFTSSIKVLFDRLSTASGLAEWFADDVKQDNDKFVFEWSGSESEAVLVDMKPNEYVIFKIPDSYLDDEYVKFSIVVHPITGEVSLFVTDFTDEDEEEDSINLWNQQIETLHRVLGA